MHRISSAHAIAFLALCLALTSGAYAAGKIGPRDIKRNAVRTGHVKNGTLQRADLNLDLRRALLRLRGPQGPAGPKGDRGPRGRRGATGATGATGPAGPFPDALPAGKTLRGTFAVGGGAAAAEELESAVTFAFPLATVPVLHVIATGAAAPSECPGTVTNPAATAGHLCVYEAERVDAAGVAVFDPTLPEADGVGKVSRYGFGVRATAVGPGSARWAGSWAVTGA